MDKDKQTKEPIITDFHELKQLAIYPVFKATQDGFLKIKNNELRIFATDREAILTETNCLIPVLKDIVVFSNDKNKLDFEFYNMEIK